MKTLSILAAGWLLIAVLPAANAADAQAPANPPAGSADPSKPAKPAKKPKKKKKKQKQGTTENATSPKADDIGKTQQAATPRAPVAGEAEGVGGTGAVTAPAVSSSSVRVSATASDTPPRPPGSASDPASETAAETAPIAASPAERTEVETLRQTTVNLISLLVESGIITQEKAQTLLNEAKRSAAQTTAAAPAPESKTVRVPYVPQFMRDEMREEIKKEVMAQAKEENWAQPNALPGWVSRIRLNGDFRLRYQGNYLSHDNAPAVDIQGTNAGNGLALLNTTKSFDYLRYQLRLGLDAQITDRIMVGTRLASGNTGNPVSLNQTLGNSFNKNSLVIDLAYVRGDPYDWLTLTGGRMPNPFFSTDLVWYDQLNFDGLAATGRAPLPWDSKGSVTVGAFPIETIDCTSAVSVGTCGNDKWLYAAQAVFEKTLSSSSTLKVGLAYYGWQNYEGRFNDPVTNPADRTYVPKFAQKGNTYFNVVTNAGNPLLGLAPRFKDIDLLASLDMAQWDPIHVVLTGDYVRNIGYDRAEIRTRTNGLVDQAPRTNAWYARLSVGHPQIEKLGDWQVYGGYKYVQRDSVVDGYNDPDFHFGGTDAKGYLLGGLYGLAKNSYLRLRWLSANSIDGPPLQWDVLQLDLVASF
jgi:hypothetical protein